MSSARAATTDADALTVSAVNSSGTALATATAGSNQGFRESLSFKYGASGETAKTLTLDLPVATINSLNAIPAASMCTSAELATFTTAGAGCPASAKIGTVSGTASAVALGLTVPVTTPGTLYLMPAKNSSNVADIGIEVDANILDLGLINIPSIATEGSISYHLTSAGEPYLQVVASLPDTAAGLPYTLETLDQTIDGSVTGGGSPVPFTYMPSAAGKAAASLSAAVQYNGETNGTTAGATVSDETGTATGNLTVTAPSPALPYHPTVKAVVTKDAKNTNIGLTTTITQAAGQSASKGILLTFPDNVPPSPVNASHALCNLATTAVSKCAVIGSVTAASPLAPVPLVGKVYLTGSSVLQPDLTLVFSAPFSMVITGAVTLPAGKHGTEADFKRIPDLPLSRMVVKINGGSASPFITTCTPVDATVKGGFTGQNGALSSATSSFQLKGCPASQYLSASASASGLTGTERKPALTIRAADKAAKIRVLRVTAPAGFKFVGGKLEGHVAVSGARLQSLTLKDGRVVITLKAASSPVTVKLSSPALSESAAQAAKIDSQKEKSLKVRVGVKLSTGKQTFKYVKAKA